MTHKWFRAVALVAFVASSAASPAWAGIGAGETTVAAISAAATLTAPAIPSFATQIEGLLAMRTAMMDRSAPQPSADCNDAKQVARRVAALEDLDAFARMTINGLIDAAPSSDLKADTSETLTPVLLRHRAEMTAEVAYLMDLPLVRKSKALDAEIARLAEQTARP